MINQKEGIAPEVSKKSFSDPESGNAVTVVIIKGPPKAARVIETVLSRFIERITEIMHEDITPEPGVSQIEKLELSALLQQKRSHIFTQIGEKIFEEVTGSADKLLDAVGDDEIDSENIDGLVEKARSIRDDTQTDERIAGLIEEAKSCEEELKKIEQEIAGIEDGMNETNKQEGGG